jgi:hypothetical protein
VVGSQGLEVRHLATVARAALRTAHHDDNTRTGLYDPRSGAQGPARDRLSDPTRLAQIGVPGGGRSNEVKDEFERLIDRSHLVPREMPSLVAECLHVDGPDHFAHHARRFLAKRDLGMEARRWGRGRRRADHDRRERKQIVGLDYDGVAPAALDVTAASRDDDRVHVTADHESAP